MACLLALLGCSSNEIWTTPLAPPRAAIVGCAVTTTTEPPEEPVDNLATVRCHFTGIGKSCVDLAIEQACQWAGTPCRPALRGALPHGQHRRAQEHLAAAAGVSLRMQGVDAGAVFS